MGKKLVFNPPIENKDDNNCLAKCLAAHMIREIYKRANNKTNWNYIGIKLKNPQNIVKNLKLDGTLRIGFDDLKKLEKLNKIKINCYKLYRNDTSDRYELRLMKRGNLKYVGNECNLLFYQYKNASKRHTWHTFLIKTSMQRFLKNFTKTWLPNPECKICNFCFSVLENTEKLIDHKSNYCVNRGLNSKLIYPKEDEFVRFRNFAKAEKTPILGFFDCECGLIDNGNGEKIHKPLIYSQIIIDTENMVVLDFNTYRGQDCIDNYLDRVTKF